LRNVGLNRAFIYAGTPSVVASLWSVEDEATMELMVAFYDYLENKGYTKGAALRQAQIDVLQNPATAHPYYWAGFVLTGDSGEVTELGQPSDETLSVFPELSRRRAFWFGTLLVLVVGLVLSGTLGRWWWARRRRILAHQALFVRFEILLEARQRLESEPETAGRARAMKQIAQELREIGQQYHQDEKRRN
jgi:hypothetical protein